MKMRHWLACLLLIGLVGGLCGCSLNRDFVKATDDYAQVILPRYVEYVEKDETLDADSKRIRTQTAERFQMLIDEAKKQLKEDVK